MKASYALKLSRKAFYEYIKERARYTDTFMQIDPENKLFSEEFIKELISKGYAIVTKDVHYTDPGILWDRKCKYTITEIHWTFFR